MNLVTSIRHKIFRKRLFENVNHTRHAKNCLLLYVSRPFEGKKISLGHQNQWQAKEMVRIIGEFGYNVDVMNYDAQVKLTKKYDLIIDLHPGLNQSYQGHQAAGCRKVAYITGSNPSFCNSAELKRIEDLERRRGVRLQPRRHSPPFHKEVLESFDAMLFIGNSYNLRSFDGLSLPPVYPVVNNGYTFFEPQASKRSAANFVFLARDGQVHKGLDLLLDFFALHPQYHLYICSNFKDERDFCELYANELTNFGNIHPVGFLDITSAVFREVCNKCVYTVLPSCSEGIAGSVLTGMSAGLIPIVSRECGFEEDEVIHLDDCTPESIGRSIAWAAEQPADWVDEQVTRSLELIKTRYGSENYSASLRAAFREILGCTAASELAAVHHGWTASYVCK